MSKIAKKKPYLLLCSEGGHSHGNRKVGLACACRADAYGDGVVCNAFAVPLLPQGLWLDGLALGGDADAVTHQVLYLFVRAFVYKGDAVADVLLREHLAAVYEHKQALNDP